LQRILIDENLSPSLVPMAHERGFECSHINHLGLTGQKDWELKTTIIDGDWTFVTNNGVDFRRPANKPGSSGEYADVTVHAGLEAVMELG
jgi:predicted nuclease of predicted toxin-antitoxin system